MQQKRRRNAKANAQTNSRKDQALSEVERLLNSLFVAICSSEDTWVALGNIPEELATSQVNAFGVPRWTAVPLATNRDALIELYKTVPGPLPKLFESLLLSYRWLRVEIPEVTLLGNPPGPTLEGFQHEITRDLYLYPVLFQHKLVEFGKAPGGWYDPICFDLKRSKAGDCPIVRIDHESVLIHEKPRLIKEVAPGFTALAETVAQGRA